MTGCFYWLDAEKPRNFPETTVRQTSPTIFLRSRPTELPSPPCNPAIDTSALASPPVLTAYIVVRRDLPLGVIASFVAHAAGHYGPHPPGSHVVILGAPDETVLTAISNRLTNAGIAHNVEIEDDEPFAGQRMAIGLALVNDRTPIRKLLSSLPLLK